MEGQRDYVEEKLSPRGCGADLTLSARLREDQGSDGIWCCCRRLSIEDEVSGGIVRGSGDSGGCHGDFGGEVGTTMRLTRFAAAGDDLNGGVRRRNGARG